MKKVSIYTCKMVKETKLYNLNTKKLMSPMDALTAINELFDLENECVEKFGVLYLNTKNEIIGASIVSVGTLNASLVHPRETFRGAVMLPCNAILVFHNHPSGNPEPSNEDIQLTERLVEAGKILGISVTDHVIVGQNRYASLKEKGLI